MTLLYEGKKCIHSRFCVTGAPTCSWPTWLAPGSTRTRCPSMHWWRSRTRAHPGAIRYRRKDGKPDESTPPVNLLSIREGGGPTRCAPSCRSRARAASSEPRCVVAAPRRTSLIVTGRITRSISRPRGEPATGAADMLAVRNGPLSVEPQTDGPLQVRGNLEIISGTGRVVARVQQAMLCRCGGSANKPFCDGTHARIGFSSG